MPAKRKPTSAKAPLPTDPAEKGQSLSRATADRPPQATLSRDGAVSANSAPTKRRKKSRRRRKSTQAEAQQIFDRFHAAEPNPKGELNSVNVFTLLVAVVLSAQATDAGVNKATKDLFAIADTPEQMLALGEDRVRDHIRTIGLYRNKAKNVILLSQRLVDDFGGDVPADRDTLETLPGVGRKTANVVMNICFGEPTMAVDTHVFRLANRIGLSSGKNPAEVEDDLMRIVPQEHGVPAHHWLILHGRYVCKARKPDCPQCLIRDLCHFKEKTPSEAELIAASDKNSAPKHAVPKRRLATKKRARGNSPERA